MNSTSAVSVSEFHCIVFNFKNYHYDFCYRHNYNKNKIKKQLKSYIGIKR